MNFKIGDTVELKSGGPTMTVQSHQGDGGVYCIWFNQTANGWDTRGATFKSDMLKQA